MFIADVDSDAASTRVQRGSGDSEKRLGGVAPFIERNPDNLASTLEWRVRVFHSQEATQASSSRRQHVARERWRASLEIEIERIGIHYHEQEKVLERAIAKLEQSYEREIKELEKEEKDEEDYPVAEWWEDRSDYQPTECSNDGNRYLGVPERELEQRWTISTASATEQHLFALLCH